MRSRSRQHGARREAEQVQDEFIWVLGLDSETVEDSVGKVFEVNGYNDIRPAADGGSKDMAATRISEGREILSISAASWVVSSAWTGIKVMALPLAISSRMRTSIRTAEAGTRTVSSGAGPIRNCSGSAAPIWEASTRLVSFARIASASEGSAGASGACAI